MSPAGWQVGALAAVGFLALGFGLRHVLRAWWDRRWRRAKAHQAAMRATSPRLLLAVGPPALGVLLVAAGFVARRPLLGVVLGATVWIALDRLPAWYEARRLKRFEAQLPDALTSMANSLRAGLSLAESVHQVAAAMPQPIAGEFAQAHQDYGNGRTIVAAVQGVRDRVGSRHFDLAYAAFRVGMEQGGNVADVFRRISASIREIWKVQEKVDTATTKGRTTARFMRFMPIFFLGVLAFMDPEALDLMFDTLPGNAILAVAVLLNVLCFFWIRKILAVEV